jgi:hypothetical protein
MNLHFAPYLLQPSATNDKIGKQISAPEVQTISKRSDALKKPAVCRECEEINDPAFHRQHDPGECQRVPQRPPNRKRIHPAKHAFHPKSVATCLFWRWLRSDTDE